MHRRRGRKACGMRAFWVVGLLCAFGLMLVNPTTARADIKVRVWVRLLTGGQCKVHRTIDTNGHSQVVYETLDCSVYPEHSNNSYYFETKLEGNVLEQLIDAAQFSKAVYDFASDIAAAVGSGGSAAVLAGPNAANDVRTAYNEFNQLMAGWGGKAIDTQDTFTVSNPNSAYRWVEVILAADSDNDPFEKTALAPASPFTGVTIDKVTDEPKGKFFKVTIDLTQLPTQRRLSIPVGLAVGEGDCHLSCLKISKTLNVIVERPDEGPVVANTTVSFSRHDPGCEACSFDRTNVLMHNTFSQGEKIQQTAVSIRQAANGDYYIDNKGKLEKYDSIRLGIYVDSQRFRQGGSRIELNAGCHPQCPSGFSRQIGSVISYLDAAGRATEGKGGADFTFRPQDLPVGTVTLVFNASYEAGRGGTIAQHMVKLTKEIVSIPAIHSVPMAASADGGGTTVSGAGASPRKFPTVTVFPMQSGPGRATSHGQPVPSVATSPTNLTLTPLNPNAGSHPANIAGQWKSSIGLIYDIEQTGRNCSWRVRSNGQSAKCDVNGDDVEAQWYDAGNTNNPSGHAKGSVKRDSTGAVRRIEWSNGIVFTR